MISSADNTLWTRRFAWLVGAMVVFRALYLLVMDLELSGDEAYYWDWGRQPDWCYFSKPPLIAWLMALIRMAFGYSWEAVRLTSAVIAAGTLTMIFLLGRSLFDARAGFFAALLMLLTPAFSALSNALINDAPLMLCWSAALVLFWRALQKRSAVRWLLLSLVIGVGVLAKQMMLVFPVLMILFAMLRAEHRAVLRRPGFWLCIIGSLLFMTPVILWNIQHDWITAKHTGHHFAKEEGSVLLDALQFPVLQAVMYAVVTWGLLIVVLAGAARRWRALNEREFYLLVFSLPGLLFVALLTLRQHVNENWPAVYYVGAFVLAGGIGSVVWQNRALWVGGAITAVMHLILPLSNVLGIHIDKLSEMRSWSTSGTAIGGKLATVPRPDQTFVYVLGHRHAASQLAFHLPTHPRVYRWNRFTFPESQYEIWPSAADKIGWDAFIIDPLTGESTDPARPVEYYVRRNFESVENLGQVQIPLGGGEIRRFNLFLGRNMLRYPESEEAQIAVDPRLQLRQKENAPSPPP